MIRPGHSMNMGFCYQAFYVRVQGAVPHAAEQSGRRAGHVHLDITLCKRR